MTSITDTRPSPARLTVAAVLAAVGTVLVGIPLVAPVVLAIGFLVAQAGFHFDFLMPGELFLVVLGGGAVLVVAALLAGRRRVLIGALLAIAAASFAGTTWSATATGLASGRMAAEGWPLALVVAFYAIYCAAAIGLVVAGILLSRDLRHYRRSAATTSVGA